MIDDGSTDNSPTICDEYASKDSRIKSIHVENGGAYRARALVRYMKRGIWGPNGIIYKVFLKYHVKPLKRKG